MRNFSFQSCLWDFEQGRPDAFTYSIFEDDRSSFISKVSSSYREAKYPVTGGSLGNPIASPRPSPRPMTVCLAAVGYLLIPGYLPELYSRLCRAGRD